MFFGGVLGFLTDFVYILYRVHFIGTTHITNGCYRLHPVEWNIGESVGLLVVYALKYGVRPVEVRESANHLRQFQRMITSFGVETKWPE